MHRKRGNKYKKLLRDSKGHKNKHIFTEQSSGGQRAAGREARRLVKAKPSFWCWSAYGRQS